MEDGGDLVALLVIVASPFVSGFALHLFFVRFRQHRIQRLRVARLAAGNVLVLTFLLSVAVLAGEVYYRFWYDTTDSFGLTKTTERWFLRHYHHNRSGYRDSVEYSVERAPGKRRITFVGDSFTVGHGVPDVEARFANRLRAVKSEWEVQVVASNGWDTSHELDKLAQLQQSGVALDDVVLVYCLNDVSDILPDWQALLDRIYVASEPGRIATYSYLFNALHYRWFVATDPAVSQYYRLIQDAYEGPPWEQQKKRLQSMRDIAQGRGGRLLVVTFPFLDLLGPDYAYEGIHQQINAFWQQEDVPHLDLLGVYRHEPRESVVVNRFDPHPNEHAHELAAQAIQRFLDEHAARSRAPQPPGRP